MSTIPYINISVGSRATQSAVASSAYITGTDRLDERTGEMKRFSEKGNIIEHGIELPENAPQEWQDGAKLWNAVEASEKQHNAQLFRSFEFSLPPVQDGEYLKNCEEITEKELVMIAKEQAQSLKNEGMCVEWAVHCPPLWEREFDENGNVRKDSRGRDVLKRDENGKKIPVKDRNGEIVYNKHIHMKATMRAIDKNGKFLPKRKTEYLLDKDGNKIPELDKNGNQKIERKTGRKVWKRQDIKTVDWNEHDKAEKWRADYCRTANKYLSTEHQLEHKSQLRQMGIDINPRWENGQRVNVHSEEEKTNILESALTSVQNEKTELTAEYQKSITEISNQMALMQKMVALENHQTEFEKQQAELKAIYRGDELERARIEAIERATERLRNRNAGTNRNAESARASSGRSGAGTTASESTTARGNTRESEITAPAQTVSEITRTNAEQALADAKARLLSRRNFGFKKPAQANERTKSEIEKPKQGGGLGEQGHGR